MATVKDYLRNFAKASARFSQLAHSSRGINYTPVYGKWSDTIVAPEDGVFAIVGTGLGFVQLSAFDSGIQSVSAGEISGAYIPVKKGTGVNYFIPTSGSVVTCRFIPVLGSQ